MVIGTAPLTLIAKLMGIAMKNLYTQNVISTVTALWPLTALQTAFAMKNFIAMESVTPVGIVRWIIIVLTMACAIGSPIGNNKCLTQQDYFG